jgi:hypothetical protein
MWDGLWGRKSHGVIPTSTKRSPTQDKIDGMAAPTDHYGLALSTGDEAAEAFRDATDRLLTLELGALEALERSVQLDPGFAMAHAVLATVLAEQSGSGDTIDAHLQAACRAAHLATEREASFVAVAVLWCSHGLSGDSALVRHVLRWPTDAYAVSLLAPSIASAGVNAGVVDVWPLLDELDRSYPGDWWLPSLRAFAKTEQHRWSEAEDLAGTALAARPEAGHASHAMAHVYYETGRHGEAVAWLDGWLDGAGANQRFRCHFSWHSALHELAQGHVAAVRRRFDRELGGVAGSRALVDSGSLLARCAAHGHPLGARRAAATCEAAGEVMETLSSPFIAWHAAVLAGVCADVERLTFVEDKARRQVAALAGRSDQATRSCAEAWGMAVLVCRAVRAALDDDHAVAAALLSSLGDTRPLGGSPAQRELLDDLALRSLVAAGEPEAASHLATLRLQRRPNAFDTKLCRRRSRRTS